MFIFLFLIFRGSFTSDCKLYSYDNNCLNRFENFTGFVVFFFTQMSFIAQGVAGAARVVTEQPTSNNRIGSTGLEGVENAGGWIPAIERAILKVR